MVYATVRTAIHAIFRLLFTVEYYGVENVPSSGPVIVAGNHPSYLDPVLVILPLDRRVFFMAWDKLFRVPVLGAVLRAFGAFPVRLGTRDPNAYGAALDVLQSGKALGIFPEAGRSAAGPMNPLKTGTARLALEAGAPIVPVTITGAFDAWPSSRRLPWPRKITVKYHEPIVVGRAEAAARAGDGAFHDEIMARLRETIERRLLPSLAADERKRRVYEGPASFVRIYELYPLAATFVAWAIGGPLGVLLPISGVHFAYLVADVWWIPQGRAAKALRDLATPAAALALGPGLARTVHIAVPEWLSLVLVGAGATLCFNWANRYSAERFARGALIAFFLSFAVARHAPHPFAPHLAVAAFSFVYALAWRPLYWYVLAPVTAAYGVAVAVVAGRAWTSGAVSLVVLALVTALYIRFVKLAAHDGRMV